MVGGADVDVGQGVGAVQEFGRCAEIWDWFPNEQRFRTARVEGFTTTQNRGYEINTSGWGAAKMEGF